jgi:hypothetical protein
MRHESVRKRMCRCTAREQFHRGGPVTKSAGGWHRADMPVWNPADCTGFGRMAIQVRLHETRIRPSFRSVVLNKGA